MKRDFVSILDFTKDEIYEIFDITKRLKSKKEKPLQDKTFVLIFEKPSLRTRVTFETGIVQLGGASIYLAGKDIGFGVRETIKDIAQNLSRWVDGIIARTFAHKSVEELAKYATIPVINALSDDEHPCQVLADLFTIYEKVGKLEGVRITWIGDGNNVCHSLMLGAKLVGAKLTVATPHGYEPKEFYIKNSNAKIIHDPREAVKHAEFIYTDVWASMGQEAEREKRLRDFQNFQVNSDLLKFAPQNTYIMHCLPAHRGEEITDEVIDLSLIHI